MRSRMSIQRLVLATLALILLSSVTAFGASTKLVAWVPSDYYGDGFKAMIPGFQAKHPDIDVDVQVIAGGSVGYMEKVIVAIASGAPPDIAWVEGSEVKELAVHQQVLDVTRALEGIRFTPAETGEVTFRGKMWAAPYHTTARGLFKNANHLSSAGLDPNGTPANLDELAVWSEKLTKRSGDGSYERVGFVPWGSNWGEPGWIWTFGGRLVDETGIRPTANEPKNVEAVKWIGDWAARLGNNPTPVKIGWNGLAEGSVSMSAESASVVRLLLDKDFTFTTGPVPHPPGGRNGTWAGGDSVAIPAGSKHKDEAMALLRYFGSTEGQLARYRQVPNALPANWDALATVAEDLPVQYAPLIAQMPETNSRTPLWLDYYVKQLIPEVRAVVRGEKSAKEALDRVQQHMEIRFAEVFGK